MAKANSRFYLPLSASELWERVLGGGESVAVRNWLAGQSIILAIGAHHGWLVSYQAGNIHPAPGRLSAQLPRLHRRRQSLFPPAPPPPPSSPPSSSSCSSSSSSSSHLLLIASICIVNKGVIAAICRSISAGRNHPWCIDTNFASLYLSRPAIYIPLALNHVSRRIAGEPFIANKKEEKNIDTFLLIRCPWSIRHGRARQANPIAHRNFYFFSFLFFFSFWIDQVELALDFGTGCVRETKQSKNMKHETETEHANWVWSHPIR